MNSALRGHFIWPAAGILLGALVSINPWYQPPIPLELGIAAWFAALLIACILSAHPVTARLGCIVLGLFLAVPCLLRDSPLFRALLMCCMAFPFAVVALPLLAPPGANFRARLTYLFTWLGTRAVERRPHSVDLASLVHLITATLAFAIAMYFVKMIPESGPLLLVRWLAGGIMVLMCAEMVTAAHHFITALMGVTAPALMQSPSLSVSLAEFWTKRWNPVASFLLFRTFFFKPLARYGVAFALFAAFFASAVAHLLLPLMATGRWYLSLMCGAFFLLQPPLILAERAMHVRHWPTAAARMWTIAALALTSPLFVEPVLQIVEPTWGPPGAILTPTISVLTFAMLLTAFFSLGSLVSCLDRAKASGGKTSLGQAG